MENQDLGDVPTQKVKRNILSTSLHGKTLAENTRHGIIRVAFMNCLLQNSHVQELLNQWEQYTGLTEAARQFAPSLSTLARERGLVGLTAVWEAYRREVVALLEPDARTFVSERLALPWRWIAEDLIDAFVGRARAVSEGGVARIFVELVQPDPPAPQLPFHFEPQPGESVRQAQQRLYREFMAYWTELSQPLDPAAPQGNMPREAWSKTLTQHAEWFYYYHLCREPINRLAQRYVKDRHTIRTGIHKAKHLLNLSD